MPRNAERGLVWLGGAADGGRAGAQLKLARLLARGDDGVTPDLAAAAARYYEMAADQGHASAAYELANLYAAGDGLPEDGARAVRLYQQAVAQGDSRAYVRIGDVHGRGQGSPGTLSRRTGGMPRPRATGVKGPFRLGEAYERGNGVEADQVRALMWYSLADAQGYAEAAERVARASASTTLSSARPRRSPPTG